MYMKTSTVAAALSAFVSVSSAAPQGSITSYAVSTPSSHASVPSSTSTSSSSSASYTSSTSCASYTSSSSGASYPASSSSASYSSSYVTTPSSSSATYPTESGGAQPNTPVNPGGLSKTQQIFLSDTRVDAFNNVLKEDSDFLFDFNAKRVGGPGKGGEIVLANRKTFPALTDTGLGMAVGFLGPCGFNTPHVHPRATELLIVTKGTLVSEMVIENGVAGDRDGLRNVVNEMHEMQAMPFYQGALHTQFNPDCEDVTFIAPLSSEDPGVNTMAQAFFALDDDVISATAGNSFEGADIDKVRNFLSTNVALGVESCLKKCGIAKRK